MKYKVGDIIVSASSDSYVGEIIYISKEEDTVRHRCRKTGTEYEKSYFGFQCRYMSVEERLEKDKEFCTENIQLHQQILTMEREHNDAIAMSKERRESIDALTAQLARREREHEALLETAQKALSHVAAERDEACEELETLRGLIEGEPWAGAVLRRDFVHLQERVEAAGEIISANGCDCECDHDAESHDESCERCLACRISSALRPSVSK